MYRTLQEVLVGGSYPSSSCTLGRPHGGDVGFKIVGTDSEEAQRPVSIAIETDQSCFQLYTQMRSQRRAERSLIMAFSPLVTEPKVVRFTGRRKIRVAAAETCRLHRTPAREG